MQLYIQDINPNSAYGVWHITEDISALEKNFDQIEIEKTKSFHPKRRAEYFTTRLLLQALANHVGIEYKGIYKDDHGKPFLIDSTYHISISHAYPYVACIIHKNISCGIDIEIPRDQLRRIQYKFLSNEELSLIENDTQQLCQYWCAKETLYKIYGRKNLIFAENIKIYPREDGSLFGKVVTEEHSASYILKCIFLDGYYIVYNI